MPVLAQPPFVAPVPREVVFPGSKPGQNQQNHSEHRDRLGTVLVPGFGQTPEPTLPLPPYRPPTAVEKAHMRRLYQQGLSRNRVCHLVYGFKNGKVYGWVNEALAELGEEDEEEAEPIEHIIA